MSAPVIPSPTSLRRAFVDITQGYSSALYGGKQVYIRHLGHTHHVEYDLIQAQYENEARARGGKTEAEKLADLVSRGLWTSDKDRAIENQRAGLRAFEDARKSIILPSVLAAQDRQIAEERAKLSRMMAEKAELIGMTVEIYAQTLLNDHYIVTNLFTDASLKTPLFNASDLEDFSSIEMEELLAAYHAAIEPCTDGNLRHLAVADFFTSYYNLCADDLQSFYGIPVCNMTYYQVRLGNIAKGFKALIDGIDMSKVDPALRNDPEAIERMYIAQRNNADMSKDGKVPVGMSNSDMKTLGYEGQLNQVTEELSGAELVAKLRKGYRGPNKA